MLKRRIVNAILAVFPVFVGGGTAWAAQSYGSSSSSLKVTGYGSTASSYGSWSITQNNGTRSSLSASVRINNADDHKVYARLTTYVKGQKD